MAKEFFDDDLIERGPAPHPHTGAAGGAATVAESHSVYGQRKREIPEQVNQTTDEIERLRQRQENLEQRKQALVDQRRRIETFEHGRREMLDKLGRSAVLVVREGEQASRMSAVCSEVGSLFSKLHQEMEAFAPERWTEEAYDAQLTQALAQIEAAASEYRRAMDRINALAWNRGESKGGSDDLAALGGAGLAYARRGLPATFMEWLVAGFAFLLPIMLALGLAGLLYYLANKPL